MLENLAADFLENILKIIFSMYQNEFERKQAEQSQDELRENFTIEQVFDENEVQLIEELRSFID